MPPAALSRSSEGLTAHWHPWKRLGMADGIAFGPESVPYRNGMVNALQQSAPNAVAAPLRGRPHRTVPDKLPATFGPVMGGSMTPAAVKTSHKVLLPLGQSHSFQDFSTKRALFFGSAYIRVPCPFAPYLLRSNRLAPSVFLHALISSAISLSMLLSSPAL